MSSFLIQTNIPIFHHSIIPFGLQETSSIRNAVIPISCRNSDTFDLTSFKGFGINKIGLNEIIVPHEKAPIQILKCRIFFL